jgi:hypothetical protein
MTGWVTISIADRRRGSSQLAMVSRRSFDSYIPGTKASQTVVISSCSERTAASDAASTDVVDVGGKTS